MTGFELPEHHPSGGRTAPAPAPSEGPQAADSPSSDDWARGAPAGLRRIQDFVNSVDVETGEDDLDTPAALRAWISSHGLPGGETSMRVADLARAIALREALREVLAGNAGHGTDPRAIAMLDAVAEGAPLRVRFAPEGRASLTPAGAGLEATIGAMLADIAAAVVDGSWNRLKVCREDTCLAAFYDASRNRSRTWCDMAVCGNRDKGRRYRQRARAGRAEAPGADAAG